MYVVLFPIGSSFLQYCFFSHIDIDKRPGGRVARIRIPQIVAKAINDSGN